MSSPVRAVALILLLAHAAIAGAAPVIPPIERALRAEDHAGAERLARTQLDAAERSHGNRSMPTLLAIDALVEVLLDGERIETPGLEALITREEVLAGELAGKNSREFARALMRKANWFSLRREYPQFTQTIHAAGTVAHSTAGETPERVEIDLQSSYSLFYMERKPVEGKALIQQCYDALKEAADPDPRLMSKVLRMYARIQFDDQARHMALPAMREYEAHARTVFGERSARRSDALTWLGYTLRESGQYAEGIDALRQGEEIAARLRPYRQRLHVDALIALAQNLGIVGDTEKARATFERGLAIEERQQTANGYLMGLLLNSLGVLHGNQGEYEKASS
jgi:tetratricopeptide (TPR) repeat protein